MQPQATLFKILIERGRKEFLNWLGYYRLLRRQRGRYEMGQTIFYINTVHSTVKKGTHEQQQLLFLKLLSM